MISPKSERDDRQVVAAQPQDGKAQHDAEARGEQAGQRQAGPEAEAEGLREQGVGIGADRIEGDVAKVEQAGQADHDVQAPAEHDVDQHSGRDVDHVAVGERQERQDEGEDQARSGEPPGARSDRLADAVSAGGHGAAPRFAPPNQLSASRPTNTIAVSEEDPLEMELQRHAGRAARRPHAEHRGEQHEGDEGGQQRVLQCRGHAGRGRGGRSGGARHRPRPSRSRACPAGRSAGRSGPPPGCRTRPRPCTGC